MAHKRNMCVQEKSACSHRRDEREEEKMFVSVYSPFFFFSFAFLSRLYSLLSSSYSNLILASFSPEALVEGSSD